MPYLERVDIRSEFNALDWNIPLSLLCHVTLSPAFSNQSTLPARETTPFRPTGFFPLENAKHGSRIGDLFKLKNKIK